MILAITIGEEERYDIEKMTLRCPNCGTWNTDGATACAICEKRLDGAPKGPIEVFRRQYTYYPRGESSLPKLKSRMPVWIGVLLFIVAFFDFGGILVANLYVSNLAPELGQRLALGSAIVGGFAIFTIMGAALAFLRKMWGVCMVATVAALIFHIPSPLPVLLTMGAVAGLLMCKQEFE